MLTGGREGLLTGGREGVLTGGREGVLIGGREGLLTGGREGLLTGGREGVLTGGREGVLIGGREGLLTGGREGLLTGGREGVLTGGREGVLTGGREGVLTGGREGLLTGGREGCSQVGGKGCSVQSVLVSQGPRFSIILSSFSVCAAPRPPLLLLPSPSLSDTYTSLSPGTGYCGSWCCCITGRQWGTGSEDSGTAGRVCGRNENQAAGEGGREGREAERTLRMMLPALSNSAYTHVVGAYS